MKISLKFALIVFTTFIAATTTFTQEWTKAQKEVWQVVEDNWTNWKAGDIQGMTTSLHEMYQGRNDQSPLPWTKEQLIQRYMEIKDIMKLEDFSINPVRIIVTKNAAVVDYYYMYEAMYTRDEKKELKESSGQNVEFYVKEGEKWLLLGDMTIIEEEGYNNNDDE
jgi:hypothetical protein